MFFLLLLNKFLKKRQINLVLANPPLGKLFLILTSNAKEDKRYLVL